MKLRPTSNPPHRWTGRALEFDEIPPPPADLKVFEERARSILAENDSPDIGYRWSLNPYRGCFHGCAYCILLRLPAEVKDIFIPRLQEAFPDRADKVLNGIRAARGGKLNDSRFGHRMSGDGPRWEAVRYLFDSTCRRLGLNQSSPGEPEAGGANAATFCRPNGQMSLFGA